MNEPLDLVTLARHDRLHAVYLAIGEIWHGRSSTEILARLKWINRKTIVEQLPRMMERYPSIFYYKYGCLNVYMDYDKIPKERKEAMQKAQSKGIFTLGIRRDCSGTITKLRLGAEFLGDCVTVRDD